MSNGLTMRTRCERCAAQLGDEDVAYICSYECTYCESCFQALGHVCPNCGGELTTRPRRLRRPDAVESCEVLQQVVTVETLQVGLAQSRDELIRGVNGADEAIWSRTAFDAGWTRRDLLAHIASIEWTYPRLLEMAEKARNGNEPRAATPASNLDAYNQAQVEKRKAVSIQDLLEEFSRNRARTIAAVAAVDDPDLWKVCVRAAIGREGPLLEIMWFAAVEHVRGHLVEMLDPRVLA